jgi:hypothetical protein
MVKSKNTSRFILVISFLFFALSLKSQTIIPFNKAKKYEFDFYLPKLELEVELILDKQEFIPSEFSGKKVKKYIPVKPQKQHNTFYLISDITTKKHWIADVNRHFAVINSKNKNFYFTPFGTLAGINCNNCISGSLFSPRKKLQSPQKDNSTYNKFFIKKNFKQSTDTTYKIIQRDSTFIKKPVINKKTQAKNEEDKIYDLVHYLVKTRKRKFRLISGLDTTNYYPEALKIKLQNLDSLENILYNLLVGYKKHSSIKLYFDIDFSKSIDTIAFINPYRGLTNINGIPVIVKLDKTYSFDNKEVSSKGLPFIMPEMINLTIFFGHEEIYKETIPVPQLGKVSYINTSIKSAEYYPWGGIKKITTKN